MHNEARVILQHIFNRSSLQDVSIEDLSAVIDQHPYVGSLRYLLAKKMSGAADDTSEDLNGHPALFFHNPLWFEYLLQQPLTENAEPVSQELLMEKPVLESRSTDVSTNNEAAISSEPVQAGSTKDASATESSMSLGLGKIVKPSRSTAPLEFEPYHTIDYFASQGIRLQAADLNKDKFGQQLKSFTEWLKSMKRIEEPAATAPSDVSAQENVARIAEDSNETKDVYTEAMAEVWAKQGNIRKAEDIYRKLSLLNPDKSAYFAAKIEQLNT